MPWLGETLSAGNITSQTFQKLGIALVIVGRQTIETHQFFVFTQGQI